MGVSGGGECVRERMSGSEWRRRQCVRGSVSGSEWRGTLALTHCLPLHSLPLTFPLTHCLPLHSPFLSRTVSPSIHSVEMNESLLTSSRVLFFTFRRGAGLLEESPRG